MTPPIDVRERELFSVEQFRVKDAYRPKLAGVLIPEGEIRDRVARLGKAITHEYRDSGPNDFYPICVLKGAMRFYVDLLRELDLEVPYSEGIVRTSRYREGPKSETPEVRFFQPDAIEGKDVLLIEDILDQGHTLAALSDQIETFDPRSVAVATLFNKPAAREVDIDPAFQGFLVPDEFLVGYGLDYGERYRDCDHVGVLDPAVVGD